MAAVSCNPFFDVARECSLLVRRCLCLQSLVTYLKVLQAVVSIDSMYVFAGELLFSSWRSPFVHEDLRDVDSANLMSCVIAQIC